MLKGADTAPKKSAMNSRRKKYLQFALKYKDEIPSLIPIFPLDLGNLMRYVLYLASDEGNVKAGWSSCSNFVSEIIIMGKLRGWEDPREGARNKFLWDRFRQNFRTQVQVVRKAPRKLRMTPAHLQAIVATMDLDTFNGLRWATAFVTLWHSNARVGHVAPKSARHTDHVWKYEDLVFAPSLAKAETVLIHFRSTKTRAAKEDRSFWTALGKVELKKGQPNTCPVRLLQAWVQSSYTGNPKDPLFGQVHDTSTPIVRAQFTSKLRQSLEEGAKFLAPPHNKLNPKAFSGVSFRKGSLSAMSGTVEFNRLRERADHKCPESTSHYVSDSVQTRAQSSLDVHARFGRAQEHRKEEQSEHTLWIIPVWHSDFPKHAHAQVMITTGMPTENEMTEDKMQHVTLQKRSKARVEDIDSQVHSEVRSKLTKAAEEHTWVNGKQEVAAWLATGLKARDVKWISQTRDDTVAAVHFTSATVASLFKIIAAAGAQQTGKGRSITDIPAWATASYISTCKMVANAARRDVRAWAGAFRSAEEWARERSSELPDCIDDAKGESPRQTWHLRARQVNADDADGTCVRKGCTAQRTTTACSKFPRLPSTACSLACFKTWKTRGQALLDSKQGEAPGKPQEERHSESVD